MKRKNLFESISILFSEKIWTLNTEGYHPGYLRLVRFVKLVRITLSTFAENRMGFQCVSLSYFVTLAIVPFCALLFALGGGLGISDKLSEILYRTIPDYPQLVSLMMDKAGNIINIAKSGGVGIISALMFLWTIIWLMFQVERVFNNVWGIRKIPRNIFKRFGFYFLVMFLSPFLVLLFGTGIAYYTNLTDLIGLDLSDLRFLPKILGYAGFYILAVFTLTIMYKYIPATDVAWRHAFRAALFDAVVFTLFQYFYLKTQVFVARLNTVYGVLAAIPLFLIWLNFSWQIIIYGAELTYSYQNVDTYRAEEPVTERRQREKQIERQSKRKRRK